eukprot:g65501.t1
MGGRSQTAVRRGAWLAFDCVIWGLLLDILPARDSLNLISFLYEHCRPARPSKRRKLDVVASSPLLNLVQRRAGVLLQRPSDPASKLVQRICKLCSRCLVPALPQSRLRLCAEHELVVPAPCVARLLDMRRVLSVPATAVSFASCCASFAWYNGQLVPRYQELLRACQEAGVRCRTIGGVLYVCHVDAPRACAQLWRARHPAVYNA